MKKIIILFLILSGFTFLSCQKEEVCYSCNSDIDAWVKENKANLTKLSSNELLKFDGSRQAAVFRAMESSQKELLWVEKFNTIISTSESFSGDEKEHIKLLKDYILDSNLFNSTLLEEHHNYLLKWVEIGKRNFSWSDVDIAYLLITLYTTDAERDSLKKKAEQNIFERNLPLNELAREVPPGEKDKCTCNTELSLCGIVHDCLDFDTCEDTESGCGLLWLYPCDGECYHSA